MVTSYRQPVGKSVIDGTLTIRVDEEDFFDADPGLTGRTIEIHFGDGGKSPARLYRSAGRAGRLKLVFSGKSGRPLRSWLRAHCPARKGRLPRGVLVLERLGRDGYRASVEKPSQAAVLLPELGAQRFFSGARPLSVLNPALMSLKDTLATVHLPDKPTPGGIRRAIDKCLIASGWRQTPSVGTGLMLSGGLRRSGAELHLVLEAQDLYLPLLSLGASLTSRSIDLGVILVADGSLSRILKRNGAKSPATLDRAVDNIRTLGFVVRGPLGVFGLTARKTIR